MPHPHPSAATHRPSRRDAFTLLEIVVVLVLIGIVSAVVAPSVWHSIAPDSTSTLTEPVVSLLHFAQRTAAQQNEPVRVVIDPSSNKYNAESLTDGVERASGTLAFQSQAHFLTDSARLQVIFDPTGTAESDSLVLTDDRNVALVRVNRWTGAIDVVHP